MAYQFKQSPKTMVVLAVCPQVILELVYSLCEKCYLHLGGTGITLFGLVLPNQGLLSLCSQHLLSSAFLYSLGGDYITGFHRVYTLSPKVQQKLWTFGSFPIWAPAYCRLVCLDFSLLSYIVP